MRSGNPALNQNTFLDVASGQLVGGAAASDAMSLNGTVNKTGFMLLLLVATATLAWSFYSPENPGAVMPFLLVGGIGGFIVAIGDWVLSQAVRQGQKPAPGQDGHHRALEAEFAINGRFAASQAVIAGYLDIIPHFERSEQIDISLSLTENTGFTSWISTLLPFSTTTKSSFFKGDIAFIITS